MEAKISLVAVLTTLLLLVATNIAMTYYKLAGAQFIILWPTH
jgi:hypothetical protein